MISKRAGEEYSEIVAETPESVKRRLIAYCARAMNLSNALTLLRIFFVPMLVAALVQGHVTVNLGFIEVTNEMIALSIFLLAAATDLLDGYLARRWGQITTVGALLDPIADKLLVSSALVALVEVRVVPAWMTIVVIGREFAISGLRSIAASEGYIIKASDFGKAKLVAQVVAISLLMLSMRWSRPSDRRHRFDVVRCCAERSLSHPLLPELLAQGGCTGETQAAARITPEASSRTSPIEAAAAWSAESPLNDRRRGQPGCEVPQEPSEDIRGFESPQRGSL